MPSRGTVASETSTPILGLNVGPDDFFLIAEWGQRVSSTVTIGAERAGFVIKSWERKKMGNSILDLMMDFMLDLMLEGTLNWVDHPTH